MNIDSLNMSLVAHCRNPRVSRVRNGNVMYLSCGHCPECLSRKSSRMRQYCLAESQTSKYTCFVTLTYDEANVPVAKLCKSFKNPNELHLIDITRRYVYKNDPKKYKVLSENGNMLCTIDVTNRENFEKFYEKASVVSKDVCCWHNDIRKLRYIRHKDLQDFNKRLRYYVGKVSDEPLRFFGVSEYGPRTFRPHFHALFFFNDPCVADKISAFVCDAWRYGRVECEFAKSTNGVASYVAGYLNSFTHLPHYLSDDAICPKITHSRYMGVSSIEALREDIYRDPRGATEEFVRQTSAGLISYKPTSFNLSRLFPRIYGFSRKSIEELRYLYESFARFSSRSSTVGGIVEYILTHQDNAECSYFLSLCDLYSLNRFCDEKHVKNCNATCLVSSDTFEDYFCPFASSDICDDELAMSQYNRVYSVLLTSKKFLFDVCGGNIDLSFVRLQMIVDFYYFLEQKRLKDFFILQDGLNYFNLNLSDDVLYYNLDSHFDSFENNPLITSYFRDRDAIFENRIKHKKLNDANLIFVY